MQGGFVALLVWMIFYLLGALLCIETTLRGRERERESENALNSGELIHLDMQQIQ